MSDAVLYETRGPAAWITLNRPEKLNALNGAVLEGLHASLDRAIADDEVKVVVLTGAGERAFSSGYDLSAALRHVRGKMYAFTSAGGFVADPGGAAVGRRRTTLSCSRLPTGNFRAHSRALPRSNWLQREEGVVCQFNLATLLPWNRRRLVASSWWTHAASCSTRSSIV